jgi:hypothetical protein
VARKGGERGRISARGQRVVHRAGMMLMARRILARSRRMHGGGGCVRPGRCSPEAQDFGGGRRQSKIWGPGEEGMDMPDRPHSQCS